MINKYFKTNNYALYISVSYCLLAIVYIVTSGEIAERIASSQKELMAIEAYKGIVFVFLTSVMIFFITRYFLRKISDVAVRLLKTQEVVQISERRALAGALASSITHDANNILGTIFLRFENLQKKIIFDEAQSQDVSVILNSVKQLSSLMKRIKSVGGLRKNPIHKTRNKISACVHEVLQLASYHERCMNIQFTTKFGDENEYATFDSEQFSQMLLNLLINACEAFSGEQKKKNENEDHLNSVANQGKYPKENTILIEILKVDPMVILNVHDNGPGVSIVDAQRILSPFYSTKREGSGLGLMSVLMFTEDHSGELKISRSEILGGAEFSVSFLIEPNKETTIEMIKSSGSSEPNA